MRGWLRLLRLPFAPTAAADVLACTALALTAAGRGLDGLPLGSWAALGASALLLYAYGMVTNDLVDLERDRREAPDRPLPSGEVAVGPAWAASGLLVTGALVLGGGPAGSSIAVGATVVLAALYNLAAKRHLVAGALALGGARLANAATGALWLVMEEGAPWTALLGPLAVGVYAAGITVLSTMEDYPSPRRLWAARLLSVAAFALAGGGSWLVAGHPTLGVVVAAGAVSSATFGRTPRPGPPKRQVREMLLGLYFLAAVLASGGARGDAAWGLAALGVALTLIYASQWLVRALAAGSAVSRPPGG